MVVGKLTIMIWNPLNFIEISLSIAVPRTEQSWRQASVPANKAITHWNMLINLYQLVERTMEYKFDI